jgi:hypothetical protein
MIRSHEKIQKFRKKRSRDEERAHESKKRKRNKKLIQKQVVQESTSLSSEDVSNEFSLSSAKIIFTSYRILNLIHQSDDRARQLFEKLKEIRQQYQAERMTKLIQSSHQTIDEVVRNEYNYSISEHTMQRVILFISINVRTQEYLSDIQMTSQTSSNVKFSVTALNTIFDLKNFLSELETITFERDEIEKDVSIDQVRSDSQLKRIILTSFNENDVIMRRVIEYNNEEQRINVKRETYRVYREVSLKTRDIIYRQE